MTTTARLLLIYIHYNGPTSLKVASDNLALNYDSIGSTLSLLMGNGVLVKDKRNGGSYSLTGVVDGITAQEESDYVHSIATRCNPRTRDDLVALTGMTGYKVSAITTRLKNLGLIRCTVGQGVEVIVKSVEEKKKHWTTGQIKCIKENYGITDTSEIVKQTGKTRRAVQMMAFRLGLTTKYKCHKGHDTVLRKAGKRVCNVCHAERERERRAAK